tara:strand:- start:18928 stop:19272 length:345 start_codon:yes stop_codon:yes gene_type:complete
MEDARLRVMRLIKNNPGISSRKIAELVGVSNGSAYYIINALVKKGLVKFENFSKNPKKKQYVYLLTPEGLKQKYKLTLSFVSRKRLEFQSLREEINLLENELDTESGSDPIRNE